MEVLYITMVIMESAMHHFKYHIFIACKISLYSFYTHIASYLELSIVFNCLVTCILVKVIGAVMPQWQTAFL